MAKFLRSGINNPVFKVKVISVYFLILSGQICFSVFAGAQNSENEKVNLSFFLDCSACDFTYVRQELPFISFVREPGMADVHILVTSSETGGGGDVFFFNFFGRNECDGLNFEYNVTTNQSDTDYKIREALLKIIKTGIVQYYSKTGSLDRIDIDLSGNGNKKADELVIDRWNKWVFR
ncbi:MAG: hypothetical protein JXA55_09475, partial [Bacteroidales bacterium]|nr:hypothetical protein [Bacteroidales bacterium]